MTTTREALVEHLNEDLGFELGAVIQCVIYSAQVSGPHRPQLAQALLDDLPEELEHARFLANKIVALGGTPLARARPLRNVTHNREIVEAALTTERAAIARYTIRAREAESFGDKGLAVALEDILRSETAHAEELSRMLADWPE